MACMLLAASIAACVDQSLVTPTADALIVQAVLDAAASDQYVIVQSTTGAESQQAPVKSAVVTLTLPDGRQLVAAELVDSVTAVGSFKARPITTVYRFALAAAGTSVVPGATYGLRVVVPDGRVVTGTTTVPSAAPVSRSGTSQSFNVARDSLLLAWPRVAGADAYEVVVVSSHGLFNVFADTSIVLTGESQMPGGTPAFAAGFTHQIVVSAVDANYYDYYRRSSDPYTATGVITHLTGGLGVFGSIVEINARTVLVK
jgi:hypothetical protein